MRRFACIALCLAVCLAVIGLSGCRKPFMTPKFEQIKPNEFAFLVPYGKTSDQTQASPESYWIEKKVMAKEIEIPQEWVADGYEDGAYNGHYKDSAVLIRVDSSPVTRSWTKDQNTGTSTRDEAIWAMSSDQIKWTVGWNCTARIASIEDAAMFLSNYPNGKLMEVMDTEVRGKLTTRFNLAVTDLPMKQMQESGAPVFKAVTEEVTKFFKARGITITDLGINGPYVYDNPNITKVLEEKYTAAQQEEINRSKTTAQAETNKATQLVAEAKAKAILTEREAEATGIKSVADAKAYEIEKANKDLKTYLELKRLENEKALIERWTGSYPNFFSGGQNPSMLLQLPGTKADAPVGVFAEPTK